MGLNHLENSISLYFAEHIRHNYRIGKQHSGIASTSVLEDQSNSNTSSQTFSMARYPKQQLNITTNEISGKNHLLTNYRTLSSAEKTRQNKKGKKKSKRQRENERNKIFSNSYKPNVDERNRMREQGQEHPRQINEFLENNLCPNEMADFHGDSVLSDVGSRNFILNGLLTAKTKYFKKLTDLPQVVDISQLSENLNVQTGENVASFEGNDSNNDKGEKAAICLAGQTKDESSRYSSMKTKMKECYVLLDKNFPGNENESLMLQESKTAARKERKSYKHVTWNDVTYVSDGQANDNSFRISRTEYFQDHPFARRKAHLEEGASDDESENILYKPRQKCVEKQKKKKGYVNYLNKRLNSRKCLGFYQPMLTGEETTVDNVHFTDGNFFGEFHLKRDFWVSLQLGGDLQCLSFTSGKPSCSVVNMPRYKL